MAGIYIVAGILHFVRPRSYVSIIPSYIPYQKEMVYLSGIAEIVFGAMLFTTLKDYALWGIILMLIAFIPVHIYMLKDKKFELLYRCGTHTNMHHAFPSFAVRQRCGKLRNGFGTRV